MMRNQAWELKSMWEIVEIKYILNLHDILAEVLSGNIEFLDGTLESRCPFVISLITSGGVARVALQQTLTLHDNSHCAPSTCDQHCCKASRSQQWGAFIYHVHTHTKKKWIKAHHIAK